MCILIVKPSGVKTPSMKTLKRCWENNPDGAGVAYSHNGEVSINKGFMKWEDFKEFIKENNIDDYPAIIHFRIATHGTVKPENTHPFVVNSEIVAGHNGVLSVKNEGDWTDSETFFKRICAPILKSFSIHSEVFKRVIDAMIGQSKLAFLTKKGDYKVFGNFVEDCGVLYSNTTYKTERYPAYDDYGYGRYSGGYGGYGGYSGGRGWQGNHPNTNSQRLIPSPTKEKTLAEISAERGWANMDINGISTRDYYKEVAAVMSELNVNYAIASEMFDDYILEINK